MLNKLDKELILASLTLAGFVVIAVVLISMAGCTLSLEYHDHEHSHEAFVTTPGDMVESLKELKSNAESVSKVPEQAAAERLEDGSWDGGPARSIFDE